MCVCEESYYDCSGEHPIGMKEDFLCGNLFGDQLIMGHFENIFHFKNQ